MRNKKIVKVGNVLMGRRHPVLIKAMIKSGLDNPRKVISEAVSLESEGCEILRLAIEKQTSIDVMSKLKKKLNIPIEADIHFDYRLALQSLEKGADMIRLNPANIYKARQVSQVIAAAKEFNVPIRVGLNSGGIKKRVSDKKLALLVFDKMKKYIKFIEKQGFSNLVISAKTHSLGSTLRLNRMMDSEFRFPINLGLTASGPYEEGLVKSSMALGILISKGIGDAIRLSLNSDSLQEVKIAKQVLQFLGLRRFFPEIISCPTCSRCKVDLRTKVEKIKQALYKQPNKYYNKNATLALMGCPVNGPGEAAAADIGIAFGRDYGLLFKKGKKIKRIKEKDFIRILLDNI
jgi:(E)-4-hydroxy-3-methylbut-2-enyl-diphosphate synthase